MNNAKDIVGSCGKVFIKNLTKCLPLGSTAVAIYEELQLKQIDRKINRLEEFYQNLATTVNALEDKINHEYINRDDFLDVFEEATRYVVSERQEQKRHLFKNILAHSIISHECDYDKTERYFRLLDNLSEIELEILVVLDNPVEYNRNHGMIIQDSNLDSRQTGLELFTKSGVLTQLLSMKIHEVTDAVTVLFSNGLIIERFLDDPLHYYGNPVRTLNNLLTARGIDFVNFLKEE